MISPQGLRDEAPLETQASRAMSPKYPAAMPTTMAAPISKTPAPRQDVANPATKRAPDRIPPAAEINEPMTVPATNPAMALEWPIVSPTRAASGITSPHLELETFQAVIQPLPLSIGEHLLG